MRLLLLRTMLPFLLLAQVAVGMSPGRAICIALDACCGAHAHVHGPEAGFAHAAHLVAHRHGDCDAHRRHHAPPCPEDCANDCCDGQTACDGDCSDGSCHIHVSLPDDGGCTRDRSNDHLCDARLMSPALAVFAMQPVADRHAQATPPPPWVWPDCDRATALETDCLLI